MRRVPSPFAHDVAERRLHREKRAGQVDADHAMPMLGRDFSGRRALGRAGIGDDDIDRSMRGMRGLHHRRAIRGIRYIGNDRRGFRQILCNLVERRLASSNKRNGCALLAPEPARLPHRCRCRRR